MILKRRAAPSPRNGRLSGFMVFLLLVTLAAVFILLATFGTAGALLAVGAAAMVALMAILGPLRWGFMLLTLAFAMVPMYKGLGGGSQVTPPDLLIAIAFLALFPRFLRNRARVPIDFAVGLSLMLIFGGIGSIASGHPGTSMFSIMLWVSVLGFLPLALAALDLSVKEIQVLAWAYVAGQMFDSVYAASQHGRWYGLTTHPNYFGEYAVLAIALLTWLHQYTPRSRHWLVWGCGAVGVLDVLMSGSRAAALALAVIVLVFPLLERSTKAAFGLAFLGAIGLATFGTLAAHASSDSALGRLLGQGTVAGSDQQRSQGLQNGWALFTGHPLTGNGMTFENVFLVHNNYLEVAVATGVLGFFGYIGLIVAYNRTLFVKGPMHRLGYAPLGLTVIMAFEPSLYDRAVWCAVALAFLAYQRRPEVDMVGSDAGVIAQHSAEELRGSRT
ncbi:hypothetical protein Back2_11920 [Nocardioides baekrokdamisoli]|uniref:O-antigen ligase-related domain-containing protein n=1 Tax=Nocardioides baekrokdamisoli TaxID=1804624 RepID=A0A3G9ILK1_9ACTN|nr:O-antigen ligase family protein [Nocardioides baekrokdamisoli]BBH16905.1 hypothetical protein Back2_11920 [Nocardioides baekrokdamisoli]